MIELISAKELIFLKVAAAKSVWFAKVMVCNGCQGLLMLCINISDVGIIPVKEVDYRCIIHDISKYEAIHLLEKPVLDDCGYI